MTMMMMMKLKCIAGVADRGLPILITAINSDE